MKNNKCNCGAENFEPCECFIAHPKPGKQKKKTKKTKEESDHLNHLAHHGCVVCGCYGVEIHHIRINGDKRDHRKSIPLCFDHHRGKEGIHTLGKKEWRIRYGHESEYLKIVETWLV